MTILNFIGLLIVLFIVLIAIGEICVRLFVKPERDHYYKFDAVHKLYVRKPRLEGYFNKRNVKGYYHLNNEGWNSTRDYFKEKKKGVTRIACVGSSETGCYQVDVNDTWPNFLEKRLNEMGANVEVYTFAADRAVGLPHALHLTRYILKNFKPDIFLYNSSFSADMIYGTTDKKHYTLLDIKSNGKIREVLPVNDRLPVLGKSISLMNIIYQSRLIKYLRPKLALGTKYRKIKMALYSKKAKKLKPESSIQQEKNKVPGITMAQKINLGIDYCLDQLAKLRDEHQVKMIFGTTPYRTVGFNWSNDSNKDNVSNVTKFKELKKKRFDHYGFPYFDTTQAFLDDFAEHGKKFDFFLDAHLNAYGNSVEAKAIAKYLLENHLIVQTV